MIDLEEQDLVRIIEEEFGHKISNYWTPAKDCYEHGEIKHCLLIKFVDQELLESEYKDLELDIYLRLKDKLKEFVHYDMIALL